MCLKNADIRRYFLEDCKEFLLGCYVECDTKVAFLSVHEQQEVLGGWVGVKECSGRVG